ncbi:MAG: ABC transporter permease [Spirochaetaceae bacterium]|nr:ABC transporter permease [Spirochaetaceae bacterium]
MEVKKGTASSVVGPLIAFVIVTILVALSSERFLTAANFRNVMLQVSIVSLITIGSTLVIIAGGIDLSSGSSIALLTMVLATVVRKFGVNLPISIIVTIAAGAILGLWNGLLTAYLRIPAFITTVASLTIFRGLAFMFNDGSPVFSISDRLSNVFYGALFGVPVVIIYIGMFYLAGYVLMRYTELGRKLYAVGGNPSAARYSGIDVRRITTISFMLAGIMSAMGSVLMAARLNSGSPNYGVGLELSAIAAAVIGGASLEGGRGNIVSSLLGALTITIVQNGLNLNAVPTSIQNVITGFIILLAVFIDMWKSDISSLVRRTLKKK